MIIIYITACVLFFIFIVFIVFVAIYYKNRKNFLSLFEGDEVRYDKFLDTLPLHFYFKLGSLLHGQNTLTPDLLKTKFSENDTKLIIAYYLDCLY